MSDDHPVSDAEQRRRVARRRARLDRIFGSTLPEAGQDERGRIRARDRGGSDERLRRDVPPHHG